MRTDLEIARSIPLKPIGEIAGPLGIDDSELIPYGYHKAKLHRDVLNRLEDRPAGKYISVTAMTPTPLGEGKTVTTIGLGLALNRIGRSALTTIRQPSMGPVFGVKGGAAGGGLSQVLPMEDFNLHLTGDMHAVSAAHNLLSAWVDTSILLKNPFAIDPAGVSWKRVVDINDRALREIEIGLGGKKNGVPRMTGFDISPASEVMAILGLSTDIFDLRKRLGEIIVGMGLDGEPVRAETLEAAGAMCAVLKDAIHPTLMQTTEGTPSLVHGGPFANIAYGNSSVIADQIAVKLADYTVTESGFGADMGFEKLVNIKSRASGLPVDATVLVATIRALKAHSGRFKISAGKPLDPALLERDLDAVRDGLVNLQRHVEIVRAHGVPVIVALNHFETDHPDEVDLVLKAALDMGAVATATSRVHAEGGAGGEELAEAVAQVADSGVSEMKPLYDLSLSLEEKIRTQAQTLYGARDIELSDEAKAAIDRIEGWGYREVPICMAKTHLSLSHDPKLKGAPKDFIFPVRDVRLAAGAGFVYPLAGEMRLMPGLGSRPALRQVDIDDQGQVIGLF